MKKHTHRFHYLNSNVIQDKILIKHLWYRYTEILPEKTRKRALNAITGGLEWFTDESPLYKAISTSILVQNGREYPCIITQIK